MTGKGHLATGFLTGSAFLYTGAPLFEVGVVTALFTIGSVLPDRIELLFGVRILKHRGISHWMLLWLALAGLGLSQYLYPGFMPAMAGLAVAALAGGAVVHLLGDIPNPMGIPVLNPFRRTTLNLWRSGENEASIIFSVLLLNIGVGILAGYIPVKF